MNEISKKHTPIGVCFYVFTCSKRHSYLLCVPFVQDWPRLHGICESGEHKVEEESLRYSAFPRSFLQKQTDGRYSSAVVVRIMDSYNTIASRANHPFQYPASVTQKLYRP